MPSLLVDVGGEPVNYGEFFAPGIAHDPPRLDSYFTFWQFRTALSHVVGLGFYDPNQPY